MVPARTTACAGFPKPDAAKLAVWAGSRDPAFLRQQREHPATVQGGAAMLEQAREALPMQQELADRIYQRWLYGNV